MIVHIRSCCIIIIVIIIIISRSILTATRVFTANLRLRGCVHCRTRRANVAAAPLNARLSSSAGTSLPHAAAHITVLVITLPSVSECAPSLPAEEGEAERSDYPLCSSAVKFPDSRRQMS